MATLNANVALWKSGNNLVQLKKGDEVPDWAKDKIGDHLIAKGKEARAVKKEVEEEEEEANDPNADAAADDDNADDTQQADSDGTPDFTKPAAKSSKKK